MTKLVLEDVQLRRQQYLQSLRRVLENPSDTYDAILLVENSGSDLSDFRQLAAQSNPHHRKVEFISLASNTFPRDLGKGYGEFLALDAALQQSSLLPNYEYFVKLTGRLGVRNLHAILRNLPASFALASDVFPYRTDPSGQTGFVDTRLVIFSREFYLCKAVGLYREMNDSQLHYAEHAFYDLALREWSPMIIARLPREPYWIGSSGSTGAPYDHWRSHVKHPLKVIRRALWRVRGQPDLRQIAKQRSARRETK